MRRLLLLVALSAVGCAHIPHAVENGGLKSMWGKISTDEFIRVRGVGLASAKIKGKTARHGASRDAAMLMARKELLAVVSGVRLFSGVTVAQLMEKDSLVQELANDMVKGGDEVLTEWTDDGGCVVTLELRRATVDRLITEKSEREKGLEARVAKDAKDIQDMKDMIDDLNRKVERVDVGVKHIRAAKLFGQNHQQWPWTIIAGNGGRYGTCWNPFTICYWSAY